MIYIRVDMNSVISIGHVMRCFAIADAARMQGKDITFILADDQAAEFVKQRGYRAVALHTPWNHMNAEISELLKVLKKEKAEKLLIDSYQVTEKYLKSLSIHIKTMYIDDINAFIYPVKGLICYANYWKKFDYPGRYQNTKLFLGSKYIPLRQEFCHCSKKAVKDTIEEVLLLSGGTDPYGILKGILDAIDKNIYKKINVICGRYYTGYVELQKEYGSIDNVQIHQAVSNIEDYMISADVAVSAGGTTLYELCACGTPTISYSFADNQLDNVQQFHEDGMIDYAGDVRYENVVENIIRYLNIYQADMMIRVSHSERMQGLVDGRGAFRIVEALEKI